MDSHYNQNGMTSQYGQNPSGVSPHQLQHNAPTQQHTLPPLQGQQLNNMYANSAPHTPRTPGTPNTPGSNNNMGNFQQQQQQPQMGNQARGPYQQQMVPNSMSYQPQGPYRTSGPMMPQSSTAMSHPQAIAPAPAQNRNAPQALRPMPPNGIHGVMQHGMQSPYGQPSAYGLDPNEPPTHVVGSQGRRGILPSAPGRPPVTATGIKNAAIPAKDADGKFPCPHCTKTYLHAKHLKRHLLRHTGDRPYMCVLCRDTFSRSDILKRHFQKCSIRRGNPTGASHLSHAQAHLKKPQPGAHKNAPSMGDNGMMGPNMVQHNMTDPSLQHSNHFGIIPSGDNGPDGSSHLNDDQSQANQMQRNNSGRLAQGGPNGGGFDQGYNPGMGNSMPNAGMHNPSLAFSIPHGQNGHSYNHQNNYDYAGGNAPNMQQHPSTNYQTIPNARAYVPTPNSNPRAYVTPPNPQPYVNRPTNPYQQESQNNYLQNAYNSTNIQAQVKMEAGGESNNGLMATVYPTAVPTNPSSGFSNWDFQNDPLQPIANRLINFCCPPSSPVSNRTTQMKQHLTADNVKHFLESFSSFQGHFPVIHMPSFRIADTSDALLLAMVCIGSVYSDRLSPPQVRVMMEIAKVAIENSSRLYLKVSKQIQSGVFSDETFVANGTELEQISSIFLIHVLFTWHGTPVQREEGRTQFSTLVALAKKANLFRPATSPPVSDLHQPVNPESYSVEAFDWDAWVLQEKRSRLMYILFLTDAARVLYFNIAPLFDPLEITLPLPADDAAWDADTATKCAQALGLHGPIAAKDVNPEGSRRPRQPEMHTAVKTLLHHTLNLQMASTNLYSKFILIHALHVELWKAQRQLASGAGRASSGTSTPMSQHDWVTRGDPSSNGNTSAERSGTSTPVEAMGNLNTISNALEKWKKVWDNDMAVQYQQSSTPRTYRRFGFCRDAVHFYWLAKYMLGNSRGLELNTPPDHRFSHVLGLLQYVKKWVVSDNAKRGEELGSVGDIDPGYAVTDLTLDMAQLFKPFNKLTDLPVTGVHTNIGGGGMM